MSPAGRRTGAPGSGGSADAAQRLIAVTDFDHNLVVTAGAGTGKTALLVERALNLISGHAVPVQALAAITFTEKAAAELRQRLATGLEALHLLAAAGAEPGPADGGKEADRSYRWLRARAGVGPAEIARRSLQALLDLDVASVSTIHAFCADILRRYPLLAGVDPDFEIDEGASFDEVFERESARFLADELGPRARRGALWARVLATAGGLGAARAIGAALGAFRLPTSALDPARAYAPLSVREVLGPDLSELHDAIARARDRAAGMNPRMDAYLESAQSLLVAAREQGPSALERISAPWPLRDFLDKDPPAPGAKLRNVDPDEVRELGQSARRLIKALVAVDEEVVSAIVDAAAPLAASARRSVVRAGLVSFDALLRLARDLLAAHPGVRRELARRYRAILLDEFQDTDPLQYEILFFIAEADGQPADDPYRARLGRGRLFIVGDPKQSIYRFRGADIEAYQRAVRHVLQCGGRSIVLSSSFRSPADIVDPINRIFAPWMSTRRMDDDRFQPPYEAIDSARGPAADHSPRVEIWSVEAEGDAVARRRAEAEALAGWIVARHGAADATGEPLRYGDVAILLRALTHAGLYAQALRRAGVPFIVEGGKDFYERPEVGDLIALLRAVANPNDGPAVLAVMRSVLGGVPDGELARFAAAGGRLDLSWERPGALPAVPNIARTLDLIDTLRARTRGRAVDEVVRAAVRETPLAVLHAAAFEGAQRIANLDKLVVEAEELARRGLSLEEVIRVLEDEFRSDRDGGESPLADETLDAVRVLSIHKAKGLQYPVVFVPDIGRQEGGRTRPHTEVAWLRSDSGGDLAVRLGSGVTNVAWVKHAELTRRHEEAEEKRVFYVACTRPRERLILVNSNTKAGRIPWREALAPLGYAVGDGMPPDGALPPGVLHRLIVAAPAAEHAPKTELSPVWEEAARAFHDVLRSISATTAPPLRWPAGTRDARLAGAGEPEDPARWTRPVPSTARLAGMAFHAALERWDFKDGARLREMVRLEAGRIAQESAPAGPEDVTSPDARVTQEAGTIAAAFLASPLPQRLAGLAILGREVPILYRDRSGCTWVGACDVLYRDRDGTLVVADYKTDRIAGDPGRAAEPYGDQLRVYREAVSLSMDGQRVRGEILFVRTGDVVVME
jgi:ATP-dependent helicase/nuclease subunit A